MVILKQVRLVNWYAFNHNTFPIGRFTLIMGRNGSGKSVILDAIRYGAFGDTAFNKSTDTQGKRTLSTYTRGFMDAAVRFICPVTISYGISSISVNARKSRSLAL